MSFELSACIVSDPITILVNASCTILGASLTSTILSVLVVTVIPVPPCKLLNCNSVPTLPANTPNPAPIFAPVLTSPEPAPPV